MNELEIIKKKIFIIRGQEVMLDKDIAELYEVKTGHLNENVKNNPDYFPPDFMFSLTREEINRISENTISLGKLRFSKNVNAFTQEGVASLSGVLKSTKAKRTYVNIMRAFGEYRKTKHIMKEFLPFIQEVFRSFDLKDSKIIISNNPNMQINISPQNKGEIVITNSTEHRSLLEEFNFFKKEIEQTIIKKRDQELIFAQIDKLVQVIKTDRNKSIVDDLYFSIKGLVLDNLSGIVSTTLVDKLTRLVGLIG